jgi:hypothetical protein
MNLQKHHFTLSIIENKREKIMAPDSAIRVGDEDTEFNAESHTC